LSACASAHVSICLRASADMRTPTIGVTPVAGRPRFFRSANIDAFMFYV
jgi:hypothetical protein